MRYFELIQKAYDGGRPVPNSGPFGHGESLLVVSKRDLATLAKLALERSPLAIPVLKQLKDLGRNFVVPLDKIGPDVERASRKRGGK